MRTFKAQPPQDMPDDTVCIVLRVPNSPTWISALWWILDQYNYWYNWQSTADKRGKSVADRWREMFWSARSENEGNNLCPENMITDPGIFLAEDISMNIRISPDDPCIIQMWCIDHWEDWYNPAACIPGGVAQPADGGELEPGQCATYNALLNANNKWLLPVQVSEGYTIEVLGASGGWNDGGVGWNCYNGFTYVLGACASAEPAEVGDPLQTANHMRLIALIDGTYYDAIDNVIIVPPGVSNENVEFQANDSDLSNNSGSVSFQVRVCGSTPNYGITYVRGTGAPSYVPGQAMVMTGTQHQDGSFTIYEIDFQLSGACANLHINGLSGWTLYNQAPSNVVWGEQLCGQAIVYHTTGQGTTSVPQPYDECIQRFVIVSFSPFSASVTFTDC